tara:strand:- start:232 stop:396 length:165 start_codon:yes stop_codon:yes gene_type:complete
MSYLAENTLTGGYPDIAKIQIIFVGGKTAWIDISDDKLFAIYEILDRKENDVSD